MRRPFSLLKLRCGSAYGAVALLLCANFAAYAQRTALSVETTTSHTYAVTHRTGLLSFLGHEHVITAPKWTSDVCLDRSAGDSFARFVIDARALIIDADSSRRLAGLGGGPSPSQRQQIQTKMLDAAHLNVAEFPEMRFETVSVKRDKTALRVEGRLTIRGVTQVVAFPASLEENQDRITLTAKITFKQSAFGIKPESIAGLVKVADPVDLHIRLAATETSGACH